MVDTSKEFTLIRGRVLRVTKLDACGAKVLGPDSTVTSKGFITVGLSPQFDEGTTISVTNAAGEQCILDEPSPLFTGYDTEVNFCGVNPDLIHLMTGQAVVYDRQSTPQGVGFRTNSKVDTNSFGFALEVWSSVPAGACVACKTSYGYFLVPFLSGGSIGDISIGNDAVTFTLTGAKQSAWVAEATKYQVANKDAPSGRGNKPDWQAGYGYQFWQCQHGAYRGEGANGQLCIVLPEQDAVIAITADTGNMQAELNVVWEKLLPAFHAGALAENAEEQAKLKQVLTGLVAPPKPMKPATPTAPGK